MSLNYILRAKKFRAKKSLGQNFLIDDKIIDFIASHATKNDEVLEIGPGLGFVTEQLAQNAKRVVALEIDKELINVLNKNLGSKTNFHLIEQDILKTNIDDLPFEYEKIKVIANIPYYITSPIIQKFLHVEHKPEKIVLLIQKEVAQRLAAKPGDYSILGLSAQIYAKVTLGPVVKREFFTPPPKVDSQVVILEPLETPLASEKTMSLIKLGFIAPRKKLISNLSTSLKQSKEELQKIFAENNIDENARPADLSIEDWCNLEKSETVQR